MNIQKNLLLFFIISFFSTSIFTAFDDYNDLFSLDLDSETIHHRSNDKVKEIVFEKLRDNLYKLPETTHYSQIFRMIFDFNFETLTIEIDGKNNIFILSSETQKQLKKFAQHDDLSFENVLNSINEEELQKVNFFYAQYTEDMIFVPINTIKKSKYSCHDLFFLFQFELSADYSSLILPHSGNSNWKHTLLLPKSIQSTLKKIHPNKYNDQNICFKILSHLLKLTDEPFKELINKLLIEAGYTFIIDHYKHLK